MLKINGEQNIYLKEWGLKNDGSQEAVLDEIGNGKCRIVKK